MPVSDDVPVPPVAHYLLEANPDIDFQFVDIPKSGDKQSGWDIADAVAESMSAGDLLKFIDNARKSVLKRDSRSANRPESGLLLNRNYKIRAALANIHDVLRDDSHWSGVLTFNEFSYAINKFKLPSYDCGAVDEWFGNTDLDLNNKDSMVAIMDKWLYELVELDALAHAEATRQKSFLSGEIDEFRPAYGHRNIRNPRQPMFGGATNS